LLNVLSDVLLRSSEADCCADLLDDASLEESDDFDALADRLLSEEEFLLAAH
jgi:hypothetical protein